MSTDGFTKVRSVGHDPIDSWLKGDPALKTQGSTEDVEILQECPSSSLSAAERRVLFNFWVNAIRNEVANNILASYESLNEYTEAFHRIQDEKNLRCLEAANVIDITTSGLACQLHILRKFPSKVLVCEEAGEVLEANLLPALLPSLEHAILIGDHLQLRPQTQNTSRVVTVLAVSAMRWIFPYSND